MSSHLLGRKSPLAPPVAKRSLASRIGLAAALPAAVVAAIAFGPTASAETIRGGADVSLYCSEYVSTLSLTYDFDGNPFRILDGKFGTYRSIAKNETGKWDGWYCDRGWGDITPFNRMPVNMNDACAMLYGGLWAKNAADREGDPAWAITVGDGAYDWRCVS